MWALVQDDARRPVSRIQWTSKAQVVCRVVGFISDLVVLHICLERSTFLVFFSGNHNYLHVPFSFPCSRFKHLNCSSLNHTSLQSRWCYGHLLPSPNYTSPEVYSSTMYYLHPQPDIKVTEYPDFTTRQVDLPWWTREVLRNDLPESAIYIKCFTRCRKGVLPVLNIPTLDTVPKNPAHEPWPTPGAEQRFNSCLPAILTCALRVSPHSSGTCLYT